MPFKFKQGKVCGEVYKNRRNRIRVSRQEIGGRDFIDVRQTFYDEDSDTWRLCGKGVCLLESQAVKLRDALTAALTGGQYTDPALAGYDGLEDGGDAE